MSNISEQEKELEEKRLAHVMEEIGDQIARRKTEIEHYRRFLRGSSKDVWTEFPHDPSTFDELVELAGGLKQLRSIAVQHNFLIRRLRQLLNLEKSPYFARIDFRVTSPSNLTQNPVNVVYIGLSSLTDGATGKHLIYDWRAPVCSIYYDYEIGPAQYMAPSGLVKGEMLLKRHFRIKDGRIQLMFDNSLTIYDELLLEVLSKAKGDRMRNVVNTIQREQNKVIRSEAKGALLVQGAAGSGKTIIGLHRAAYLLYKYRDTLTSRNIVLFSPGKVFMDYTSPVLPELGEEPVPQVTFSDFASDVLMWDMQPGASESAHDGTLQTGFAASADNFPRPHAVEESGDQVEYLLERRGSAGWARRVKGISMKSSLNFSKLLLSYVQYLVDHEKGPGDLQLGNDMILCNEDALKMLRSDYAYLPVAQRVDKVKRRALWLIDGVVRRRIPEIRKEILESKDSAFLLGSEIKRLAVARANEEVRPLREKVSVWKFLSPFEAYVGLFQDKNLFETLVQKLGAEGTSLSPGEAGRWLQDYEEVSEDTLDRLRSGVIPYEDLAPLLYLRGLILGVDFTGNMRRRAEGGTQEGINHPEDEDVFLDTDEDEISEERNFSPPVWIPEIKHVIVDEVQDYSALQHQVLKMYFGGSSFTLLGDVNQCSNPYSGFRYFEKLYQVCQSVYNDKGKFLDLVTLNTSYRSTKEITEFASSLLEQSSEGLGIAPEREKHIYAVERSGEPPRVQWCADRGSLARTILDRICSLLEEGYGSIAVICKTARESWAFYDDLKNLKEELKKAGKNDSLVRTLNMIRLVTSRDRHFTRGVLVVPSYLAKGLEFEAVIIYNANDRDYSEDEDLQILYTACTRALHRLYIYYTGEPSPFLPKKLSI